MNSSLLALFLDKYPDVWLRFMEHMNMTTMAVLLSILSNDESFFKNA